MYKILIIEDDKDIADIEKDYLSFSGYDVLIENDGKQGLETALNFPFDCIILDIMLPHIDGLEICKILREKIETPIIMVTAKVTDLDKIRGLDIGADDYITKPFSPIVLVAKVKSAINRFCRLTQSNNLKTENHLLQANEISLNLLSRKAFKNDEEINLKTKEFDLLAYLMKNKDIVFDKDTLYEKIWGMDSLGDSSTVVVHINRLREKIEDNPSSPKHILTIRNAGYKFV